MFENAKPHKESFVPLVQINIVSTSAVFQDPHMTEKEKCAIAQ